MTHADDDGLVLPPRLAPSHVVIWPVFRGDDTRPQILEAIGRLATELRSQHFFERSIEVETDLRDIGGGDKQWEWIKKGIPLRIEVGPRDVANGTVMVARRDRGPREKETVAFADLSRRVGELLTEIQNSLFERARKVRDENTRAIDERAAFDRYFTPENAQKPEIHGGFALSHWCGAARCEAQVKDSLKVTIRCVPVYGIPGATAAEQLEQAGSCIVCGEPSSRRVVFAKSY
jgi:prolyl-tRNA synthetase